MKRRLLTLGIAVAILVTPVMITPPEPVLANPASDAVTTADASKRARVELKRMGVDHEVAKANGYEVRVDRDGIEYSVPAGSPVGIDNEVEGPCGWSWVDWVNVDYWNHKAQFWTGFEIRPGWPGAMTVDWNVHVIDDYGVSNKPKSDAWLNPKQAWGFYHWFTASGPTDIYAQVTWGITVLANGTICFALEPFDWTTVG